jgi:hypothetical protein
MSNVHIDILSGYYGIEYEREIAGTDTKRFIFGEFEEGQQVLSAFGTLFSFLRFRRVPFKGFIEEATGRTLEGYGDQKPTSLITADGGSHISGHDIFYEGFKYEKNESLWS